MPWMQQDLLGREPFRRGPTKVGNDAVAAGALETELGFGLCAHLRVSLLHPGRLRSERAGSP